MKFRHLLTLLAATLLLALNAHAEGHDYAAETDFFGESPVVLTVSRMHKPVSQSPASVSVIDRDMIRNSGARELADLFRMAPGFITGDLLGHTQVVTYQGLGQEFHRQMQVLIDGRSVFIPSFGGVPWASLPLMIDDIERIEITRGPNAVTYGSNAFLATINIITRHAAEDRGAMVALTQQLAGTSETDDLYLRIGDQIESLDLDWRLSVGRESDAGYDGRNDSKSLEKINLKTDFLTAHNQFWTISLGINESLRGKGDGGIDDPLREADNSNSYQNIRWEMVEPDVQTSIKLTHTRNEINDEFVARNLVVDPAFPPVRVDISFSRLSERTDIEAYQTRQLNHQVSVNYGLGWRKDEVRSRFLFADEDRRKLETFNLFGNIEWKPYANTALDLGFLSEDPDNADREQSFRLAAIQSIDDHHLRFVSSTARRHPILWEREGQISFDIAFEQPVPQLEQPFLFRIDWLNNQPLKPETIHSNEIGLFSEFMDRRLVTDIKLFRYRISDQIADITIPLDDPVLLFESLGPQPGNILDNDARTQANRGNTRVKGIELSFNYRPRDNRYRLYGALSRVQASSYDKDLSDSFPDLTAYIGGHLNIGDSHQLSSTAYYVDSMSWTDRTEFIPDYTRLDLRYQYTIDRRKDVNVELIGYNLLRKYHDYRNRDEHKPAYLLRLSARF